MKIAAVPNAYLNGGTPSNGYVIFYCECPNSVLDRRRTPRRIGNAIAEVCICDVTGLAAVPPVKSTLILPPPFVRFR